MDGYFFNSGVCTGCGNGALTCTSTTAHTACSSNYIIVLGVC